MCSGHVPSPGLVGRFILDPAVRLMKLLKTASWTRALSHLGNHRKGEPETHENAGPLRLRSGQAFDSLRSLRMTTFWRVERLNPQATAVFRLNRSSNRLVGFPSISAKARKWMGHPPSVHTDGPSPRELQGFLTNAVAGTSGFGDSWSRVTEPRSKVARAESSAASAIQQTSPFFTRVQTVSTV